MLVHKELFDLSYPDATQQLVSDLVNDALTVPRELRGKDPPHREKPAAQAMGLLAMVAGQDVEPADGSDGTGVLSAPAAFVVQRPPRLAVVNVPPALPILRVVLRVAIVVTVLIAVVAVELSSRSGVLWRLITFTYQANLLAAGFYLCALVWPRADARAGLRGAVVVYVLVAGLIWNLFLTSYSMGYTVANFLLHVVVPALAGLEWLLVGRGQDRVRWWHPLVWLIYPAAYVALALLVLNHAGRRAPYYFLDPDSVGTAAVVANIGLLAAIFLVLGYTLIGLGRTRVSAESTLDETF